MEKAVNLTDTVPQNKNSSPLGEGGINSRSRKINEILAARKPFSEKASKCIKQLNTVSAALTQFQSFLPSVLAREIPQETREKILSLQSTLANFVSVAVPARIIELGQLERRFSRGTLNIGIVGNAGQGKSTLLQSLTGLNDDEIPTGNQGDCTGAAAIIENKNVSETYADIEFYSEGEFLSQVAAPYYRKLNLPQPSGLGELAYPLPAEVKTQENYDEVKFVEERLQKGLDKYRQFLGKSSERISKDKIREYTAKSDANGNPLSIWTAVKSARVYCRFPGLENEKISVGDTPGLGDRSVLEAEERLMADFVRSIDAVAMLRRVNVRGIRKQDVTVFNLIKAAIPELDADKWSYFLVNVFPQDRTDKTASEALKFLKKDLSESSLKDIQDYIELNAADKDEVLREFDKILNGIAANQSQLDAKLYEARFANVQYLIADIKTFVNVAKNLLPEYQEQPAMPIDEWFNPVYRNLKAALDALAKDYKGRKENPDHKDIIAKIDEIRDGFIAASKERLDSITKEDLAAAFASSIPEVIGQERMFLASAFDSLDDLFDADFTKLHSEVAGLFQREGQLGNLCPAVPNAGDKEAVREWLHRFADCQNKVKDAFGVKDAMIKITRRFADSHLSFSGNMLPQVRDTLDILFPISEGGEISTDEPVWENLKKQITDVANKAARMCAAALKEILNLREAGLSGAIEQFVDGFLHTGGLDKSKDYLRWFYTFYAAKIHTPDVQKSLRLEDDKELLDNLHNAIGGIVSALTI